MTLGNYGDKAVITVPLNLSKARQRQKAAVSAAKREKTRKEGKGTLEKSPKPADVQSEAPGAEPAAEPSTHKPKISKGIVALSDALFPDGL